MSSVVGDGVSLSGNRLVISKAGAVIEGVDLRGYQVEVRADNVTIKNSLLNATGYHTIYQMGSATGLTVEYNTFDGEKANNSNSYLIYSDRGTTTVRNNEFFNLPSDGINTVGGLIEKNYFSGGGYQSGAHADAISIHSSQAPLTIRQNYIDYVTPADARVPVTNAAIKIVPHFGAVNNVTVEGNVLLGGGYTIYAINAEHSASNVKIINNDIGLGKWGDLYPGSKPANFTYQANDGVIAASSGGAAPAPTAPVPSEPVPAPATQPAPEPSEAEQTPAPTQTAPATAPTNTAPAPAPTQTAPSAPAPSPTGENGTELGPQFFVLGTYVQSDQMMAEWKARGVNTLVQQPEGQDIDAWSAAAAKHGLYMVRPASNDLQADLNNPYLLAWAQPDEPSNTTSTLDYGKVTYDPKEIADIAAPWRAEAQASGKFMPVWANHVGNHITPTWAPNAPIMKDYMEGGESDWLASDSYPIQFGEPFLIERDGYVSTHQGVAATRQQEWSGTDKPTMTFIGTSAFTPGQKVPTTGEFNAMAWSSVINGASGVIYFPVQLTPWSYDTTPPHLVTAMKAFNGEIASLQKIIMDSTKGGNRPSTIYHSAPEGKAPASGQLPYPFEATQIKQPDGKVYTIILNLSGKEQTLDMPEWGLKGAKFAPYEVKKGYDLGGSTSSNDAPPAAEPVLEAPAEDQAPSEGAEQPTKDQQPPQDVTQPAQDADQPAPKPAEPTPAPDSSTPSLTPTMTGTDKQDILRGTSGADVIFGGKGIDVITASGGNDIIVGGADKDWLSGQGGDDKYVYTSVADSHAGTATRDVICDWGFGKDVFDLRQLDANAAASGDQTFKWIGTNAFTGTAGELRSFFDGTNTIVEANVNGDKTADFQIQINGKHALNASDFIL